LQDGRIVTERVFEGNWRKTLPRRTLRESSKWQHFNGSHLAAFLTIFARVDLTKSQLQTDPRQINKTIASMVSSFTFTFVLHSSVRIQYTRILHPPTPPSHVRRTSTPFETTKPVMLPDKLVPSLDSSCEFFFPPLDGIAMSRSLPRNLLPPVTIVWLPIMREIRSAVPPSVVSSS